MFCPREKWRESQKEEREGGGGEGRKNNLMFHIRKKRQEEISHRSPLYTVKVLSLKVVSCTCVQGLYSWLALEVIIFLNPKLKSHQCFYPLET